MLLALSDRGPAPPAPPRPPAPRPPCAARGGRPAVTAGRGLRPGACLGLAVVLRPGLRRPRRRVARTGRWSGPTSWRPRRRTRRSSPRRGPSSGGRSSTATGGPWPSSRRAEDGTPYRVYADPAVSHPVGLRVGALRVGRPGAGLHGRADGRPRRRPALARSSPSSSRPPTAGATCRRRSPCRSSGSPSGSSATTAAPS